MDLLGVTLQLHRALVVGVFLEEQRVVGDRKRSRENRGGEERGEEERGERSREQKREKPEGGRMEKKEEQVQQSSRARGRLHR